MGRKEEAYEYIKNEILTNRLRPGMAIREMDISEALKISRTPIREALRDLEADGLVTSYASRGVFVKPFTPYDVEEISDLRTLIEVWSLERGFNRITDQELDQLQADFETAWTNKDWDLNHKADRLLHRTIVEKSGSSRIVQFMNTLNTQIERVRLVSTQHYGRSEMSYREHLNIIQCIRSRNLEKSKQALRTHLQSVGTSAVEAAKNLEIDLRIQNP